MFLYVGDLCLKYVFADMWLVMVVILLYTGKL